MARHIEVWYDETSDSDNPLWCVSLCEEDGEEIKCLSTHEDEGDAASYGESAAAKRKIDARKRDEDGSVYTYAQFSE